MKPDSPLDQVERNQKQHEPQHNVHNFPEPHVQTLEQIIHKHVKNRDLEQHPEEPAGTRQRPALHVQKRVKQNPACKSRSRLDIDGVDLVPDERPGEQKEQRVEKETRQPQTLEPLPEQIQKLGEAIAVARIQDKARSHEENRHVEQVDEILRRALAMSKNHKDNPDALDNVQVP